MEGYYVHLVICFLLKISMLYLSNINKNDIHLIVSGLGTITGATGHVFPFWLHVKINAENMWTNMRRNTFFHILRRNTFFAILQFVLILFHILWRNAFFHMLSLFFTCVPHLFKYCGGTYFVTCHIFHIFSTFFHRLRRNTFVHFCSFFQHLSHVFVLADSQPSIDLNIAKLGTWSTLMTVRDCLDNQGMVVFGFYAHMAVGN
jgi:hypothetical protein